MKMMEKISLRLYILVLMFLNGIQLLAQRDDIADTPSRRKEEDLFETEGMVEAQPLPFEASDIIIVILLIVACIVFGKIWKGCSYLLVAFALLMFYLLRF